MNTKSPFLELFIFDSSSKLLYYHDFTTQDEKKNLFQERYANEKDFANKVKNTFGVCYTVKSISAAISDKSKLQAKTAFSDLSTNQYKLTYFYTPSDLSFVLKTESGVRDFSECLRTIYKDVYVPYVARNFFYNINDPITIPLFTEKLIELFSKGGQKLNK